MRARSFILCSLLVLLALAPLSSARAEGIKPDDTVSFDLSAEGWASTKTARVSMDVEAAVAAAATGTMREQMTQAVEGVSKSDWRLVGFNRNLDQTGLERWSAVFEARLPETDLGGLADKAKKQSKAGLQLSIVSIDFTPTLAENEAALATLRAQIYKQANDQLAALNSALPGRAYRIATIDFSGSPVSNRPMMKPMLAARAMSFKADSAGGASDSAPMERAEKLMLSAHVVLASLPATK